MNRKPRHAPSERERRFVEGVAQGKTKTQAARDAGYAESTALKQAYQILDRPLVKTALTDALERLGITFERILQPIVDGLEATVLVKNSHRMTVKKTSIPDVPVRLQAHDRAVALLGGVPNNVKPLEPKSRGLIVMFGAIKPGNEQEIQQLNDGARKLLPANAKDVNVSFHSIPSAGAGRPREHTE